MVSSITTTTDVANQTTKSTASLASLSEDFSQFLTLLTTQLQNQDPLSPMDSSEFTNQLVQFSQVEQQINSNQKLDGLLQMQMASLSTVGLGYVGMDISYLSTEMNYDGEKPIDITYALSEAASTAKVNIYNEAGDLVYSGNAPTAAGQNKFTWNGVTTGGEAVNSGTYTVKIDALNSAGEAIENSTIVTGHVSGIETQNGVVYVLVGERAVPIASIVNANRDSVAATSNASAALGYIGMDVTYKSSDLKYSGSPTTINYTLKEPASKTTINVYDSKGTLVYTTSGSKSAGESAFMWDGKNTAGNTVSSGTYKIKVESVNSENETIDTTTYYSGVVDGVESKGGVAYVTIGGASVPAANIINAKPPTTSA